MMARRQDDPATLIRWALYMCLGGIVVWAFAIAGFVSLCRYVARHFL